MGSNPSACSDGAGQRCVGPSGRSRSVEHHVSTWWMPRSVVVLTRPGEVSSSYAEELHGLGMGLEAPPPEGAVTKPHHPHSSRSSVLTRHRISGAAALVVEALISATITPTPAAGADDRFSDDADAGVHAPAIDALANSGVFTGTTFGRVRRHQRPCPRHRHRCLGRLGRHRGMQDPSIQSVERGSYVRPDSPPGLRTARKRVT